MRRRLKGKKTRGSAKVTLAKIKHRPIKVAGAGKREVRTQFGALCYRVKGRKVEVLLITTRGRGHWIIPKGWPMGGETPAGAAATEALQEAGATGKLSDRVLGFYSYSKKHGGDDLPCVVAVFPLRVKKMLRSYPEKGERKRRWVSQKKAISLIREPELRRIIKDFRPFDLPT
ncbi:MAG: NUDIX hydrolase [Rhodobacteraceae bacterium]|nr:NUDIX hydrolase [Paracoccaceae bacterium]